MADQIDFAIAISVIVVAIAFSVFYVTGYFSRASPDGKTSELLSVSAGVGKILFESSGIPAGWENNNYVPVRVGLAGSAGRIPIAAAESGGVNRGFEEADLHIVFDKNCLNTAYNNSVRLYDRFLNDIAFRIYNYTECTANSGFLQEANIDFLFNITGNSSTIFWLYYTNNTATPQKSAYNFSYDPSLVGYWKMDSVNSTNYTLDSTANHNDGKYINNSGGAIPSPVAGQLGGALSFDGNSTYVNAENASSLNFFGTQPFSISVWIKTNDLSGNPEIVNRYNGGVAGQYELGIASGKISLLREVAPYSLTGATTLIPNIWYHVVGTYDGTNMRIYINGTLDGGPQSSGSIPNNNIKVLIGSSLCSNSVCYFFNGTIDEVRIYNRSLSADEIKALYNYTRPSYVSSSGSVPVITDRKMSAFQNLSYSDARASLDLKKNFNLTVCGYSMGRHVPDAANTIASSYPIILANSTGAVIPCLATVNVW